MNTIEALHNRLEHRRHRLVRVPTGECNRAFGFTRWLLATDSLLCLDKTLVGGEDWWGVLLGFLELGSAGGEFGDAGVQGGEVGVDIGRHLD